MITNFSRGVSLPWQSLARCQQRDWWAHAWHGDSSAHRFQVRAAGAIRNVLDGRALTQLQCNGQQLQCTVHTVGSCFLSRCMHSALLLRGKDAPCYAVPVLRRAGTELPCSRLTVRHRGVIRLLFIMHHQIVGEGSGQVMMLGATFWESDECEARFCVGSASQHPSSTQRKPHSHHTQHSRFCCSGLIHLLLWQEYFACHVTTHIHREVAVATALNNRRSEQLSIDDHYGLQVKR